MKSAPEVNPRETAKTLADLHMPETDGAGKFSRSETVNGKKQRVYVVTPAIFEGWGEADEEASPEHLEHQEHLKMRVPQN